MKALPVILILVAFIGVVTTTLIVRSQRRPHVTTTKDYLSKQVQPKEVRTSVEVTYNNTAEPLPPPAPASEAAKAIRATSVKSTLLKFRTAVAAGNPQAQSALLTSLKRHRDLAISIAEDDLRNATQESEKKSIRNALEAIRR